MLAVYATYPALLVSPILAAICPALGDLGGMALVAAAAGFGNSVGAADRPCDVADDPQAVTASTDATGITEVSFFILMVRPAPVAVIRVLHVARRYVVRDDEE